MMGSFDLVVLTQAVGFGVCLWLGLYLLVRSTRRTRLITVSVIALFAQAAFFGASMLTFNARDLPTLVALERAFWWASVLPSATWFHFSSVIAGQAVAAEQQRSAPFRRVLLLMSYLAAVCIIVLGTVTNLFINYAEPIVAGGERFAYLDRGPAYPAQIVFLGLTGFAALALLVQALIRYQRRRDAVDQALAQQLKLLVGGAVLFLAGAVYISSRVSLDPRLTVLPGYVCLLIGLGGLSYGIANVGLLLEGQDIRRDFWYNVTGIGLINTLYVGVLSLTGTLTIASLLLLVGLVTLTHMLVDNGRSVLDLLFFSRAEREARSEARDYATVLGTTPVDLPTHAIDPALPPPATDQIAVEQDVLAPELANEKAFKSAVRKAITSLKSPPQLAKSPLLTLKLVEQHMQQSGQSDNRLSRVAALRELLIDQIDGLRPKDDSSTHVGEAWRFYNVLYFPYVREVSRKGALSEARRLERERQRTGQREAGELEQVLSWLADVDEDTFYKWQRRASDTIATILWEENQKLVT